MLVLAGQSTNAFADGGSIFQVSPMNQKISLIPGERTYGTFKITNPNTNSNDFHFTLSVAPFTVDDDYNIKYENNGDYNQIVDWITLEGDEAQLPPNNTATVHFYIDTPENAPAGGQYAAIIVKSAGNDESQEGVNIKSNFGITHAIFAEVAGETIRKGEVSSINVPSFLFSGNITGTSSIKNTGNVHPMQLIPYKFFHYSQTKKFIQMKKRQRQPRLYQKQPAQQWSLGEKPHLSVSSTLFSRPRSKASKAKSTKSLSSAHSGSSSS